MVRKEAKGLKWERILLYRTPACSWQATANVGDVAVEAEAEAEAAENLSQATSHNTAPANRRQGFAENLRLVSIFHLD